MKKILSLIGLLLLSLTSYAQNNSTKERLLKQITETEAEIARLQNQNKNAEGEKNYCFEKVVYKEMHPMTNEEFLQFCKKEISKVNEFESEGNYSIVSSCKHTPNGYQVNFCVTTSPKVVKEVTLTDHSALEKEIQKINNTKEMYQSLIQSLYNELKNNGIEIVDQSSNLAVKHMKIEGVTGDLLKSQLKELKDKMLTDLKVKYNLSAQSIENENAQLVDDMTNQAESLLAFIPGGNLLTCHYLWRILKSTPELGKVLGNAGAIVNIYFQIDEFQKKLQQLEDEEKRLQNLSKSYISNIQIPTL